jgi:limonene-1,2-epoxide hydrolase
MSVRVKSRTVKIGNSNGLTFKINTFLSTVFQLFLSKFMSMTPQQITAIAQKWFEAFNEHDLEKLLKLYDEQARHYSPKLKIRQPETNGLVQGKSQLRAWWADAFKRLPNLHYEVTTLTADKDKVFMEYVRQVPGEEDMLVAEILEINEEGLITASRVYHG